MTVLSHGSARESPDILDVLSVPVVISRVELIMIYLKFAVVNKLTHTAITNLVKTINCTFASPVLPDTRYLIDKLFFSSNFVTYHALCPHCGAYVGTFV